MQQVLAVDALTQGRIDEAHRAIDLGIELQMSWLNYVLLGKVYEMQAEPFGSGFLYYRIQSSPRRRHIVLDNQWRIPDVIDQRGALFK